LFTGAANTHFSTINLKKCILIANFKKIVIKKIENITEWLHHLLCLKKICFSFSLYFNA